jgi:hypothetical protein
VSEESRGSRRYAADQPVRPRFVLAQRNEMQQQSDAARDGCNRIRASDTHMGVVDSSFRGNQASHRSAVEVPSRKMPAFIMPRPVARAAPLLPPQARQAELSTSVPPPATLTRPVPRKVPEPPPQEAVRAPSLPPSIRPVTNVPRPGVRAASVQPPLPEPAVQSPVRPRVSTLPGLSMRSAPIPAPLPEEEPFELHRKRAAR